MERLIAILTPYVEYPLGQWFVIHYKNIMLCMDNYVSHQMAILNLSPFSVSKVILIYDCVNPSPYYEQAIKANEPQYFAFARLDELLPVDGSVADFNNLSQDARDLIEFTERYYGIQVSHIQTSPTTVIERIKL